MSTKEKPSMTNICKIVKSKVWIWIEILNPNLYFGEFIRNPLNIISSTKLVKTIRWIKIIKIVSIDRPVSWNGNRRMSSEPMLYFFNQNKLIAIKSILIAYVLSINSTNFSIFSVEELDLIYILNLIAVNQSLHLDFFP